MTRSAPDQRSMLVRLLLRPVHRTGRRRRAHPVRRWLSAQFGRDPTRVELAVACRQCGGADSVSLFRLGPRRARYWCRRCGAVVILTDLAQLRPFSGPPWRTADPAGPPGPVAGPPGPVAGPPGPVAVRSGSPDPVRPESGGVDLRQVMPAAMLRWAAARSRRPLSVDGLDRPTIYQLYQRWDAHLARLPPAALAELVSDGEPPPRPGLPAFSTVVGALHDRCYRSELVCDALPAVTTAGPPADRRAVWERTEHARRWLASRADQLCWIITRLPEGRPAVPDRAEVEAAATALAAGQEPDQVTARAARAALFGTDGGPTLRTLRSVYPAGELLAALQDYLASGARPLREDVLARLTAPPDLAPGRTGS